ncbi:hypothetical protein Poly51_63640 [Rubripirellula tenax]|uniref:Uncharacterized protein n=1 Tax=Rubripirellula tenax TaxID=2528015 RepID=A0A5C6E3F4_9BACT|nr:hypothetical protein Poly51_63640 [Rubripirellula tenax]
MRIRFAKTGVEKLMTNSPDVFPVIELPVIVPDETVPPGIAV